MEGQRIGPCPDIPIGRTFSVAVGLGVLLVLICGIAEAVIITGKALAAKAAVESKVFEEVDVHEYITKQPVVDIPVIRRPPLRRYWIAAIPKTIVAISAGPVALDI